MALKPKPHQIVTKLPEYVHKTEPFPHQTRAFNRSRDMEYFALFWEVGCAKSKVIIDTAADNFERGKIDTLVVLAPNVVHRQWADKEDPDAPLSHLPDRIPHVAAAWKSGTANTEFWRAAKASNDRLKVLAINLEVMSTPKLAEMVYTLCDNNKVLLTLDECHNFKNPSSSRTKAILEFQRRNKQTNEIIVPTVMRRILTGTEIGIGMEDLYAQYKFLHPSILNIHTMTEFKSEFCVMWGFEIRGYRHIDEIQRRIAPYTDFADKATSLSLPPELDLPPYDVPLSKEQWRVYNELREHYLAELSSGEIIEAPLAINRIQKFAQIAAGHIQKGQGEWEALDATERIKICLDIIQNQARGQVILWAQFKPDIIQISKALTEAGIKHVTFFGGNASGRNADNLKAFKSDPSIKVFVATPASGSEGHNINCADTVIRYNLGVSYLQHVQATGRNYRPGQPKSVTRHTLIARRTIEVKLARAIRERKELREVFRDPEVYKQWLLEDEE
jgi:SNF2 family DNA or RNA helicase